MILLPPRGGEVVQGRFKTIIMPQSTSGSRSITFDPQVAIDEGAGPSGATMAPLGMRETPGIIGGSPPPDVFSYLLSSSESDMGEGEVEHVDPGSSKGPPTPSTSSGEVDVSQPKWHKINRCRARFTTDSSETPVIHGQGLRKLASRTTFNVALIPDTGATVTVVPMRLVKKHGLRLDTTEKDLITLHDAQDVAMEVEGTTRLYVIPPGCSVPRLVSGVVSSSLADDILLGWRSMQSWGIIGKDFPAVTDPINSHERARKAVAKDDREDAIKMEVTSEHKIEVLQGS